MDKGGSPAPIETSELVGSVSRVFIGVAVMSP